MIFNPQSYVKGEGRFIFPLKARAVAHPCINKDIIKELWRNFTLGKSELEVVECEDFTFTLGEAGRVAIGDNEYSIGIERGGICVAAESEVALLHGFMTLLDRLTPVDIDEETAVVAECCEIVEKPIVEKRMVHLCIFPEDELWEIQRFVRLCGALKYTHIILEFWGMLKYDCMRELSWSNGFSKDEIRPIIREAKDLGLELIPMFNHWGHASAGRMIRGKHVVLDQNPLLATYFSEDGWCFDISKQKVKELLRKVRDELIELFGEGEYFHIGCDEAYNFEFTDENIKFISDFINEINEEMHALGRKLIIWGDMFLYRYAHYNPKNKYYCSAPNEEGALEMLRRVDKSVIIADWQYESGQVPIETVEVFKNAGFECLLCPWDVGDAQMKAAINTVKKDNLAGYLHTTWHTLTRGMPYVTIAAMGGYEDISNCQKPLIATRTAALLRKVMPAGGDYKKAGWAKFQIDNV